MCQGNCSSQSCKQACSPVEAQLRAALQDVLQLARQHQVETADHTNITSVRLPAHPALAVIASRATEGLAAVVAQPLTPRIRCRKDDGPIQGTAITQRMMTICGCKGAYDCDCVSVENQARIELWTDYNKLQQRRELQFPRLA